MPHIKNSAYIAHPPNEVFSLALDIQEYPKFLSYIKEVEILKTSTQYISAEIHIGLGLLNFSYICEIFYTEFNQISVQINSPYFLHFSAICKLETIDSTNTIIHYNLDSRLSNPVMEATAQLFLPYHAAATFRAFEHALNAKK